MTRIVTAALAALLLVPAAALAQLPVPDVTVPAARDTEPVVLTGDALGDWAVPHNFNAKLPLTDLAECSGSVDPEQIDDPNNAVQQDEGCANNHYAEPEVESGEITPGIPIDRLIGYRWKDGAFRQIPFQVDEQFARYLDNSASGFALYSGQDQHTTYAYDGPTDREGFRWHEQDDQNPCLAKPAGPAASDPVSGFDTNDEIAFMASDAASKAPADGRRPGGIVAMKEIMVTDPITLESRYVYVGHAAAIGPRPAFDASNGYVRYQRDADANVFHFSQSSYDNYGNARKGRFWDPKTQTCRGAEPTPENLERCEGIDRPHHAGFYDCPQRRRPIDTATITTSRYKFRYDGRWLMTAIQIWDEQSQSFGPDLVDRWKARAFAQDPGSETPCCGFEEEDTNWGGSSTLLGERVGPVRAIRETWGADSGTNVIRRETFYNAEMRQKTFLRVHVIPPLDGIYAQWDFNAGIMGRFYNASRPEGVPVDGSNDEVFGNFDDPCNERYDANDTSDLEQGYREAYRGIPGLCEEFFGETWPYHQSIDVADPTFSQANAALEWAQTSGPYGTIVDRTTAGAREITPGGTAQSMVAFPYYRDDSCFDDGTGTNPGPKLNLRSGDEPTTWEGAPRKCWTPADGTVDGDARFYQGSIATHGLHIMFLVDSDNARTTMPVNEINAEQRMVMLPGDQGGSVGERYGRAFEKPLAVTTYSYQGSAPPAQQPGSEPQPEPGPQTQTQTETQSETPAQPGGAGAGPREVTAVRGVRAGSGCLATPRRTRTGIGRARLGLTRARTVARLGKAYSRRGAAYSWCVTGGRRLTVVFGGGKARLVALSGRRPVVVADRGLRRRPALLKKYLRRI